MSDSVTPCYHHRNEQLPETVDADGLRWLWFRCLDCRELRGEPCPCCIEQTDGQVEPGNEA